MAKRMLQAHATGTNLDTAQKNLQFIYVEGWKDRERERERGGRERG